MQVSERINYVYGKTSVPSQIDHVSTIMRANEDREAVLLELLETKALIKANLEKEKYCQSTSIFEKLSGISTKAGCRVTPKFPSKPKCSSIQHNQ